MLSFSMKLTRRSLLGALPLIPGVARAVERPNILLLITDQQTFNAMSCAGNRWLRTPAMDSLAASGIRFDNCTTPYPVCSPARSSLFTSRMPHETGVRDNGKPIRSGIPTMGEIFQAAGYETVYGGKWHLPKSFDGMQGFRRLIGGSSHGANMDAPLAGECAGWLSNRRNRDPFLMVSSFMNPHDICEWIRGHKGQRDTPLPENCPPAPASLEIPASEPEFMRYHRTAAYDLMSQAVAIASGWREREFREYLYAYYRLVEEVDSQIGRVLAALRESAAAANTLIAFTADHGEGMGEHRWVQKASFYQPSVRVPLILSGRGVAARGAVNRTALTSLVDILPTFCDAAGIPAPKPIRGHSLFGKSVPSRRYVVSEVRYGSAEREGRMLRTDRYKYVVFNGGANPEQLFDLKTDPAENSNLAASPDHADVLSAHRRQLQDWIRGTADDFRAAR